jgi:beta-xylosidase
MVRLADDGLSVVGTMKKVYDGWKYPEEWIVESFSQEGPKILKRGDYYYMVLAEGGTAGPPTGHMIVAARSRTMEGPWENSPYNPIVRTRSASERWWSKGHGTLVEGPRGEWYLVYHAYENGFHTLGRQTLLDPVEWTSDGWFRTAARGGQTPSQKLHTCARSGTAFLTLRRRPGPTSTADPRAPRLAEPGAWLPPHSGSRWPWSRGWRPGCSRRCACRAHPSASPVSP